MKPGRHGTVVVLAAAVAAGFALRPPIAAVAERILFDGPRGAWLASVRADTRLEVLEERDGWQRVRLEGWVTAAPGAAPPGAVVPEPVPVPAPPPTATGVLRGVLRPMPVTAAALGASVPVLLVADREAVDREHARLGRECGTALDQDRTAIATMQAEVDRVMAIDNFRDAVTAADRLKVRIKVAEKELAGREAACREQAAALYEGHATARTMADLAGRFTFEGVAPGRWRVVALDPRSDPPRAWAMEALLAAGQTRDLDPRDDRAPDPYWRTPPQP